MESNDLGWRRLAAGSLEFNALFQVLDLATTYVVLSLGGVEANPAARWMMASWGMEGWLMFKLILAGAMVALIPVAWSARTQDKRRVAMLSLPFAVMMLFVITNNTALAAAHLP